ncbi:hypothetical protein ACVR0S_09490 [Streptococcus dentapri]
MASETISIDLNSQESLIVALGNVVTQATTVQTQLSNIESSLKGISSQGLAHDYIIDDKDFQIYILRAQELQTLSEVLHQHAMDTLAQFIDKDKVLATEVSNLILQDPKTSAADKQMIKEHPQEAVAHYSEEIAKQEAAGGTTK